MSSSASRPGKRGAVLGLELLDLGGGDLLERRRSSPRPTRAAARVDEDRVGPVEPARRPSHVAEERQLAGHERRVVPSGSGFSQPAIQSKTSFETFVLLQTTMNTGGVSPSPGLGVLLPALDSTSRSCRRGCARAPSSSAGSFGSPVDGVGPAALLRQVVADAQPEVAVGRAGRRSSESSATGTRGTLTMPRLDGVDQREVATPPRGRACPPGSRSRAGRTAWPTGRRRPGRRSCALTASRPMIQTRASSSRFSASLRSSPVELLAPRPSRLAAVAVVGLVVEDDDVLLVARARGRRGGPSGRASR